MRILPFASALTLWVLGSACLTAQGSQAVIGGGCPNRGAPSISGPLSIGTTMSVDDVGCFTGQGGFGVAFFGTSLPQSQWISITLSASIVGPARCAIVLLPAASLPVGTSGALRIPIPNDPRLIGAQVSLQTFCNECGFAGCYDLLTQGVEVTIG